MYLPVHLLEKIGSEIVTPIHRFNFYSTNKELYDIYRRHQSAAELRKVLIQNNIYRPVDAYIESEWYTNFNYLKYLAFLFDNPEGGIINMDATQITRAVMHMGLINVIRRRPVVDALVDYI
jgi:hypothetical protein